MARYFVQQKYQLSFSQSREALDELKSRGDLTPEQHGELMKIIGFRNVLVHDYLDVNDGIVQAIVTKKQYLILEKWMVVWHGELDECEPDCPNENK
ncbi:HepT-like ribonuclease domain-containing protein [Methylomonas koyamae]|uniref:HepT-like ribonuclease domain-containing protein n=1 Tax=Methylomonas koyamae TaxID=702114 RepID=UPI000AAAED9B|nr:HepT-like ribonuclease domain-containing protein [Methylomonas koyamae]